MLTLADAWVHDLDPILFQIGPLAIRWYGLSYVAGFVVGWLILRALAKRGLIAIPPERVGDAIMWLVAGVVVGGRLGYCILYNPALFIDFSAKLPWWGVLRVTEGGMASHGGIVGVILAAWRVSRGWCEPRNGTMREAFASSWRAIRGACEDLKGRCPPLHVMDATALIAPVGLAFGRIANFINGELLGRIVAPFGEPAPWWAVRYPQEVAERWGELSDAQKVFIADSLRVPSELVLAGDEGAVIECWRGVESLHAEMMAGSEPARAALASMINARHPTQLYQAVVDGLVVGLVVWFVFRRPRRPGVVGAWFLIAYGLGRIATELWRLPDAGLAVPRPLGLSKGQWFSVMMVGVGMALLLWVRARAARSTWPAPMGGWWKHDRGDLSS